MSIFDYFGKNYKVVPLEASSPEELAKNAVIDIETMPEVNQKYKRSKLGDLLFGKQAESTDSVEQNQDGTLAVTTSENPRIGGLINDFSSGYQENRFTPISADNLMPNKNKGLGFRFGEGLGSLARFIESPLGRMALVSGIVGATGGNGLEALTYGLKAGVGNQVNRSQDQLYRQSLINDYGYSQDDVNNIRGYVDGNMYKNMAAARQMRDNAEFRKMYYDNQAINNAQMMQYRKMQAANEQQQNAFNRWAKSQDIAQGWERIKADKQNNKGDNQKVADLNAVNEQLKRFEATFDIMPNKLESNTLGRIRNATGFQTPAEANFNSQRTLLFNKIARDLGGEKGVLSDQDIKRIEASLPNYTDSKAQKVAKMQAIYALLNDRYNVVGVTQTNNDPLGIR